MPNTRALCSRQPGFSAGERRLMAAQTSEWIFVRRVLTVFALGALAYALWNLSDILLLMFGAALTAVALRAMMEPIVRTTGMSEPLALAAIFLVLAGRHHGHRSVLRPEARGAEHISLPAVAGSLEHARAEARPASEP